MERHDTPAASGMKLQTAKQVVRLDSLLRQAQKLLQDLNEAHKAGADELSDADAGKLDRLSVEIAGSTERLAELVADASKAIESQSIVFRFNDDQKTALGRLAKGEEVLWMQSGAAFDSLAKRGLVRVGHDDKQRVIAVLTEVGREVVKDWKE